MSGPEHYREAERLLDFAQQAAEADMALFRASQAQVHATLALAAATMDAVVISGEQANASEWRAITS